MTAGLHITRGFFDAERPALAALYWQAFGPKLGRVLGPETRALALIAETLSPGHVLVARRGEGPPLGLAGFKTADGALVNAGQAEMARHYGSFGAFWRLAALAMLETDIDNLRFLIDGICVAAEARGQGIGAALIAALAAEGAARGHPEMRLEVVTENPRARALYERQGFAAIRTQGAGPIGWLFGFGAVTTMVRPI